MTAQTSYSVNMAKGYIGQLADLNYLETVSAPASVGLSPGLVMFQAADGTVTNAPTFAGIAGFRFLGLSIRDLARENGYVEGGVKIGDTDYKATESVSVMRKGYMYCDVASVGAIAIGAALNVDAETGQLTTAAAGDPVVALTGVTAEEAIGAGGGLIKVRVVDNATLA